MDSSTFSIKTFTCIHQGALICHVTIAIMTYLGICTASVHTALHSFREHLQFCLHLIYFFNLCHHKCPKLHFSHKYNGYYPINIKNFTRKPLIHNTNHLSHTPTITLFQDAHIQKAFNILYLILVTTTHTQARTGGPAGTRVHTGQTMNTWNLAKEQANPIKLLNKSQMYHARRHNLITNHNLI